MKHVLPLTDFGLPFFRIRRRTGSKPPTKLRTPMEPAPDRKRQQVHVHRWTSTIYEVTLRKWSPEDKFKKRSTVTHRPAKSLLQKSFELARAELHDLKVAETSRQTRKGTKKLILEKHPLDLPSVKVGRVTPCAPSASQDAVCSSRGAQRTARPTSTVRGEGHGKKQPHLQAPAKSSGQRPRRGAITRHGKHRPGSRRIWLNQIALLALVLAISSLAVHGAAANPLVLKVLQKAPSNSAPATPPFNWLIPPPGLGAPDDQAPAMPQGRMAWLRVIIPKDNLYVGEMMPVQVKAYFRLGLKATLNGLPTLSSDAFTLNKLSDDPAETTEVISGVPYTVLTWPTSLAAVKAGDYSLGLELPVLVQVRDRTARPHNPFQSMAPKGFFNDPFFDDSFFDDFFGATREKPMTLKTEPSAMHIEPLPTANRPAEFTGAVGQFEVSSEATPVQVTAGDPVTLKISVTGRGNFDRVTLPGLANSAQWKTYQPTQSFKANGNTGYEGTKTFEQAVVPEQSGRQTIPALKFCYFDPESAQFVTRSTQPIAVEVAAATVTPALASAPSSSVTGSATPPTDSTDNSNGSSLAPDKPQAGKVVASLRPVFVSPWFLALQGTLLALLAGGLWGNDGGRTGSTILNGAGPATLNRPFAGN